MTATTQTPVANADIISVARLLIERGPTTVALTLQRNKAGEKNSDEKIICLQGGSIVFRPRKARIAANRQNALRTTSSQSGSRCFMGGNPTTTTGRSYNLRAWLP